MLNISSNLPMVIPLESVKWLNIFISTKWGPQTTKLRSVGAFITPMSLWFMVPITIVFMRFINHQTSLGGPTLFKHLGKLDNLKCWVIWDSHPYSPSFPGLGRTGFGRDEIYPETCFFFPKHRPKTPFKAK